MDSERRHELQKNQLADFINNMPEWIKDRNNIIYIAVIVVLVAISFYLWLNPGQKVSREQLEFAELTEQLQIGKLKAATAKTASPASIQDITSASAKLQAISSNLDDKQSQALALIKAGEAARAEAHFATTTDKKAIENQMDKAKKAYQDALDKSNGSVLLVSLANFGLGITEEELGNYEQARTYYSKIAHDPNFTGTPGAPLAAKRLAVMDDYKGNFVFVDAPKTAPVMNAAPQAEQAPAAVK